jgi:hypothetical protein
MPDIRQQPLSSRTARTGTVALVVASLLLGSFAAAQQRSSGEKRPTYRWVDDRGVVHYGDRIPSEYVRGETAVLNSQGVAVSVRPAQKTPEQQARDAELKQRQDRERQHDTFLLTTYTSVRDIESLRDQRLQQMAYARRAVETYVESLQSRLVSLHSRAQVFRPYNESPTARRMPDELAQDIVRTLKEVAVQRAQLAERMAEDRELRRQFQDDIDRYKTLKSKLASR